MKHDILMILGFAAFTVSCPASEWSQYRGPDIAGISTESLRVTPGTPPKRLWSTSTPGGFSSFAIGDGRVFSLVARDIDGAPLTLCVAWDAASGKELWAQATGVAKFPSGGDRGADGNSGGDGPRSTPAVAQNRVFIYSADMVLYSLDAATGRPIWKQDIAKDFGGRNIGWKSALSPVLDGNLVYIAGGGKGEAMLAFQQADGKLAWKSGSDAMTHATPSVATLHGLRQVVYLMQSGLVSVDARTGTELWRFPFPYRTATACSPVIESNIVFCTAGYEVGGAACEVLITASGFQAKELWRARGNTPAASLWSTPVARGGFLYGMLSHKEFADGALKCLDLRTGALKWQKAGFGTGNVILAGDRLVALTDSGEVVLIDPNPNGYQEIARFKAIQGKCWSTPALTGGRLYVRSTREGACFAFD